jgi:hypothetical protein
MTKYNPLFENAVKTKIAEITPKLSGIECGIETERPQFQPNLPYLGKNKHEPTAECDQNRSQQIQNGHKRGKRHLQKKSRRHQTSIPEQKNTEPLLTPQTSANWLKCFVYYGS